MGHKDYSLAAGGMPRNAMIMPVGSLAMLTPASNTEPHEVIVPRIQITKIPQAMRRMGWSVSAAIMDRWFESPAWEMPQSEKDPKLPFSPLSIDAAHIDEKLVTMSWALDFDRVERRLQDLLDSWNNPAAAGVLLEKLERAKWDMRSSFILGSLDMSARQLDESCQVNYADVGGTADTLDDFYGAIGFATLKVAVVGRAYTERETGRRIFHVQRCGCYLKDYYDFNGFQYLGLWTENGILGKAAMLANSLLDGKIYKWHGEGVGHVYNASFQRFREEHGRGGDFHVYSDVHWVDSNEYVDLEPAIASLFKS